MKATVSYVKENILSVFVEVYKLKTKNELIKSNDMHITFEIPQEV